jgi:peptide/nickel transport system substrate-binding protein
MKKRLLSILLACAMVVGLTACGGGATTETAPEAATEESAEATTEASDETPLVVGYAPFSSKFSPFFAASADDQDVADFTQLYMMYSDRVANPVLNGIEGETRAYNGTDYKYYGPADITITENADGTVFYDMKMREDLKFSDGTPIDIDDFIFSLYVLLDPTYDGSSTLYSQPIQGLEAYRSGMETRYNLILADGNGGYVANDFYTEEQYNALVCWWTSRKCVA